MASTLPRSCAACAVRRCSSPVFISADRHIRGRGQTYKCDDHLPSRSRLQMENSMNLLLTHNEHTRRTIDDRCLLPCIMNQAIRGACALLPCWQIRILCAILRACTDSFIWPRANRQHERLCQMSAATSFASPLTDTKTRHETHRSFHD
jgi:hypothetical protein